MRSLGPIAVLLLGTCAAPAPFAPPCVGDENCNLSAGGRCLPSPLGSDQCAYPSGACGGGLAWGELSDELDQACVGGGADAALVDAAPDGPTDAVGGPVVTTFQDADLVLGQASFDMALELGATAQSTVSQSPAVDNGILWVCDAAKARVLAWSPLPTGNNEAATRVAGQSTLTSSTISSPTSGNLGASCYVSAAGGKLVVSDPMRNRVLVWNPAPLASGVPATLVLGQTSFTTTANGSTTSQMTVPQDVWTDGTRVAVVDSLNRRVLIWTSFPTANGQAANIVLGSQPTGSATASNMDPAGVHFDGVRFYVVDRGQHRVMVWNSFPSASGQAADFAIGQPDLTTRTPGRTATGLDQPTDVATTADAVFVSDFTNDRVMVYSPFPTTSGAAAAFVLGQPDFTTGGNNPGPTARTVDGPIGLAVNGAHLWVADRLHNRALRFPLYQ